MKTEKQIIGKQGEDIAREYLEREGYTILELNWRYRRAEVDIICKDAAGILIFVEVKTRATSTGGDPEEAVEQKKEKMLSQAAAAYMRHIDYDWEIRFDVVAIRLKSENSYSISHYEDAFWPGKW